MYELIWFQEQQETQETLFSLGLDSHVAACQALFGLSLTPTKMDLKTAFHD